MSFTERAKLTALAIVKIFETSRPFGDYSAVAVLDDGAGVSYGTSQFTHRSGSLRAVLNRFHKICDETGVQPLLVGYGNKLMDRSAENILRLSQDERFKNGLRAAGEREAMRQAQREIAYEMYLKPALDACEGSDFECPLSLAVIYDSINHGSYQAIRDRVTFQGPGNGSIKPEEFEREWITRYVKARHAWLNSKPRLVKTAYRTKFFLEQIARNNWNLDFPVTVHGYRLTEKDIPVNHLEGLGDPMTAQTFSARDPQNVGDEDLLDIPGQESAVVPAAGNPESVTENVTVEPAVDVTSSAAAPPTPPVEVAVDAPEPTGFMAKLKTQLAAVIAFVGGGAGLKEWFGVQLSPETVDLLKILLPTVLGLGFLGFLVWFVSEKVIGYKTLKLKAEYATNPERPSLRIDPK